MLITIEELLLILRSSLHWEVLLKLKNMVGNGMPRKFLLCMRVQMRYLYVLNRIIRHANFLQVHYDGFEPVWNERFNLIRDIKRIRCFNPARAQRGTSIPNLIHWKGRSILRFQVQFLEMVHSYLLIRAFMSCWSNQKLPFPQMGVFLWYLIIGPSHGLLRT